MFFHLDSDIFFHVQHLVCFFFFCSVVAMETRQYVAGDVITMRLMRREKGTLVAMPIDKWVKVEGPVRFGGERLRKSFSMKKGLLMLF